MKRIKVGILGATGMVGQRFIQLLDNHPWFEVAELAASERSAGKTYKEAMEGRWKLDTEIPERIGKMKIKECKPDLDCKLVFSALDSAVAGPIEEEFASKGYIVSSNSKNHRMEKDVPLVIPEVNAKHLRLVDMQKRNRNWKGFIVTNPNCTTIGLVIALKPLQERFGLRKVIMTSMQAISGAGYPGVASLDILDNVLPFIGGEEEKVESETLKLLGAIDRNADIRISAHCNRVNVNDGHTETVSAELEKKPEIDELVRAFEEFNPLKELNLPSAPKQPIIIKKEEDRPQPKLDRMLEKGMATTIGRIRRCNVLDYKFVLLSHNTIRGAAGAAILNAELMKAKEYLD